MYTIKTDWGKHDISKDRLRERKRIIRPLRRSGIEQVQGMLEVEMEAVAFLIKSKGYPLPTRIRVLDAHGKVLGEVHNDDWLYLDCHGRHKTYRRVEDWIRRNEAHYDALYIHACNDPKQPYRIQPKSCFVVYALKHNHDLTSILLAVEPQQANNAKTPITQLEIVPPIGYIPVPSSQEPRHCRRIEMLRSLRDKF